MITAGLIGGGGGLLTISGISYAEEASPRATGTKRPSHFYIVGDIGGTKSRIQMYRSDQELKEERLVAAKTFPSQEYGSLTTILEEFIAENKEAMGRHSARACVMAVAGPVELNRVYMPNTNWNLDGEEMAKALNINKVVLMNDFVGVGYGILGLDKQDYISIQDKPCNPRGPIVVFGPGTGLGQAYLTCDGRREYTVWPSEGGHADWAPRTNEEMRLWHFLKNRIRNRMRVRGSIVEVDHVSNERVISGSGIADLYDFFRGEHPEFIDPKLEMKMNHMDKSAVVSIHGAKNDNFLCRMVSQSSKEKDILLFRNNSMIMRRRLRWIIDLQS